MGMTCACHNLRRASRAVTQHFDAHFEPLDLKATQFTILAALGWSDAPTITELADTLVLEQSSLSRNLAVLRRRGLVHVGTGKDGRSRTVTLTSAGEALLAEGFVLWQRAQRTYDKALGAQLGGSLPVLRKLTRVAQSTVKAPGS